MSSSKNVESLEAHSKKVALVEAYFRKLKCPDYQKKIEKINLHPDSNDFFICIDKVIEYGPLNKKYNDSYIDLKDFVTNLLEGKFSVGTEISNSLKSKNERLQRTISEFDERIEMEKNIIEEDMSNLKDCVMREVETFFADYIDKLKDNLTYFNKDLIYNLKQCDELLKDELLLTIEKGGFFDFDRFYMEFEKRKDDVRGFGNFLKSYLAGEKQKKIHKIVNDQVSEYDWIFEQDFELDKYLRPYVLNIEKLEHLWKPVNNDPYSILNGFSSSVSYLLESNLQRTKHFLDTNSEFMSEYRKTNQLNFKPQHLNMDSPTRGLSKSPSRNVPSGKKTTTKSSTAKKNNEQSPPNTRTIGALIGTALLSKTKAFVLQSLTYNNAEDLAYDCHKFVGTHVSDVTIS
jgi:hypothetical protein